MTWRRATRADLPEIEEILRANLAVAMFPLGNLLSDGFETDAPRGMRFWWDGAAVFGLGNNRMGFAVGPTPHDWSGLRPLLKGERLIAMIGETKTVRAALRVLELDGLNATIEDVDEPHFALTLSEMTPPDLNDLTLTPITDAALATDWRAHYLTEITSLPAPKARALASGDVAEYIARDTHRFLVRGGRPVAMTGITARVETTVQIGGVFTPPELRGQGLARAAAAMHLREVARDGVTHSVLSAANPAAARAYAAIGYRQICAFTFWILGEPLKL